MASVSGGDKFDAAMAAIAAKLGSATNVRVGFLEGATYEDGTSVGYVAAINEFGATVQVPEHQIEIFRKISKDGDFLRGGRFVKESQSNFATTHDVAAHTITIPARPFFRPMIDEHKGEWGEQLGEQLKESDYDANKALGQIGAIIAAELRQSILGVTSPPNAPSTIAKKGSSKPLEASGHMLNSVDFETE